MPPLYVKQVGSCKPNPDIFKFAIDRAKVSSSDAIVFFDGCAASINCGAPSIRFSLFVFRFRSTHAPCRHRIRTVLCRLHRARPRDRPDAGARSAAVRAPHARRPRHAWTTRFTVRTGQMERAPDVRPSDRHRTGHGLSRVRIGRGEAKPLPGFDEKEYVARADSDERSVKELAHEFAAVRHANLWAIRRWAPEDWDRIGNANGKAVSARAIAYIMAGHVRHHMALLREHTASRCSCYGRMVMGASRVAVAPSFPRTAASTRST